MGPLSNLAILSLGPISEWPLSGQGATVLCPVLSKQIKTNKKFYLSVYGSLCEEKEKRKWLKAHENKKFKVVVFINS